MKGLKFQTRLILGFSLILFFSFIIGIISFIEIKNISKKTEAIYRHPLAVSNSVRDINISINAIHRSMKDVVLAKNIEELYESILVVNKHDRQVYTSFKVVQERFLGEKEVVNDAYQAYRDWEKIRNEVIMLKKGGHDERAADITRGRGAFHVNLLFEKTKILTDFAQNKADEFYLSTLESEQKSFAILITSISLILLISIGTALWLSKSISRPIHRFIDEISTIFTNEDDLIQNIQNKSEQEILGITSKKLKSSYQKLNDFNKELDKQIEQRTSELKEAKEKAEESEQLKSAFLANMSHEIRTPLNSILGFSEFLHKDDLPREKKKLYLDMIDNGGQRLLTIISDIVDISKIEAKQFSLSYEIAMLNEIIDKLHQQFSIATGKKGIELKTLKALDDYSSFISTDITRLSQVFSNLLENSIKFTNEGEIEFGYQVHENRLVMHVRDTGIGIPKDFHHLIFERFRQTDLQEATLPTGTGLGLSIAQGIVELFGGKIWLESEEGTGACFYFELPYLPTSTKQVNKKIKADEFFYHTSGKTILVVEDEPSNYIYVRDLLSEYNYNILHAENGKDAVDIINNDIKVDLILMDIKMPVMNGLQATREIRKTNKTIPVIAQTAHAMSDDKRQAFNAGCNDFLAKPITFQSFSEIVQKHLSQSN
ncbi:response regulator [Marinifilum caeruleilacunae]|uniref:histidine kinase n=1 Tax=Marinifilum caeruleilacunae TaxID=2499076 RepID=A0ABX1WUL8_9BACT|nr:response regulator [Marinifilum caeruleilacunae]NOU59789.1 response regulator [Marinifilum caeruleilacunae]